MCETLHQAGFRLSERNWRHIGSHSKVYESDGWGTGRGLPLNLRISAAGDGIELYPQPQVLCFDGVAAHPASQLELNGAN
jgi:hypothetical protein